MEKLAPSPQALDREQPLDAFTAAQRRDDERAGHRAKLFEVPDTRIAQLVLHELRLARANRVRADAVIVG